MQMILKFICLLNLVLSQLSRCDQPVSLTSQDRCGKTFCSSVQAGEVRPASGWHFISRVDTLQVIATRIAALAPTGRPGTVCTLHSAQLLLPSEP